MSSFLIKWVTNRFLKDNQFTKFGVEDPYYENVLVGHDRKGKPKHKKQKRRIPKGISDHDTKVLLAVKQKAFRYDMWFTFFGLRFGLSNVVGLIPVVGAIVSNFWSLSLFWKARSLEDGLPLDIQLIFLFNILVDFLLSLIPIVGDIIEIGYKANSRNFLLLEKHLFRIGQRNMGLISNADVRPGFLNDKVQPYVEDKIVPYVEDTIVPGVEKAGEQIKKFVKTSFHSPTSPRGSAASVGSSASVASSATTQYSDATALGTLDTPIDDDTKSIRSFADLK
ncbi:hypothetical protein JCM33374_g1004 [Metschnikowia sp. JCM 33374]|nr:hypothetical protein JCM33374_g1004 [Metschnikowia sp. JCM 33374]